MDLKEYEIELAKLETSLERLKSLYEQWFQGMERLEPQIPRKKLERAMARLRREPQHNTRLRFRFQQLVQRYTTYISYWQRVARQIEEGTYRRDLMRARRQREAARKQREQDRAARRAAARPQDLEGPEVDVAALAVDEEEIDAALGNLFRSERSLPPGVRPSFLPPPHAAQGSEGALPGHEGGGEGEEGAQIDAAVGALFSSEQSLRPAGALSSLSPPGSSIPPARRSLSPFSASSSMPPPDPLSGSAHAQVGQAAAWEDSTPPASFPGLGIPKAPSVPADAETEAAGAHSRAVASALYPGTAGPAAPSVSAPRVSGRPSAARPPPPPVISGSVATKPPAPPAASMPAPRTSGSVAAKPPPPPASVFAAPASARRGAPAMPPPAGVLAPRVSRQPGADGASAPSPQTRAAKPAAAGAQASPAQGAVAEQQIRQLYDRYMEARRKNNERTDNVTLNRLAKSVGAMMPKLEKKHPGKRIDFEVVLKDGRVALKPVAK